MKKGIQPDDYYGYCDAQVGFYDKWYRHNREDDGRLYDEGWQRAKQEGLVPDNTIFIDGQGW